ncbi:MAG: hypothetical protein IMX01_06005 [Limnochordaceae bacterium]|nr:hypothetical protein [Limnochordaceae bacterium]
MRAVVIYSRQGGLRPLAEAVGRGIEKGGWQVQVVEADPAETRPLPGGFDLVCLGSPTLGFFRGHPADDVEPALLRCRHLEGVSAAAFVRPHAFATEGVLRQVMGLLEKQGAIVQDFAAIRNAAEAEQFGQRLSRIKKPQI